MKNETATKLASRVQDRLEALVFGSRWLLAPLYVGLALSLLGIVYLFGKHFLTMMLDIPKGDTEEATLALLALLDLTLLANLILMVIFAGYENFVSKINIAETSEDRPHWMGRVDYSGLKVKLIGSLVAISVIQLLSDFMRVGEYEDYQPIGWRIGIHLTFVVSGVLFAWMDLLADKRTLMDMRMDEQRGDRAKK